jgi:uncharacterized coiled-coil DUF342 family protein
MHPAVNCCNISCPQLLLLLVPQAHSQESQLEFAHQQLDALKLELNAKQQELNARQQELNATLRGASDTERCARAANEQLADQVDALKQELNATRRELDAGQQPRGMSCYLVLTSLAHAARLA